MAKISPSEITPEHVYISRRKFMIGMGAFLATTVVAACKGPAPDGPVTPGSDFCASANASRTTDELGARLTSCEEVISYNNYYEFSLNKGDVAIISRNFKTSPWTVAVGGLVNKPRTFEVAELLAMYPPEERVYRLRCVETWSMVIPWLGFPLARLLKDVEPASNARYVRFETLHDPPQMPGQRSTQFKWPYVEGLRLDEAMHALTILATGLYGKPLPPQDGAPIRVVVPWKYGFKSIKSIVKIDLVEEMPVSFWMAAAPSAYGFYANVNPDVPRPWSQSSERRIDSPTQTIRTLPFNGYAEEVASLYAGMDLSRFF